MLEAFRRGEKLLTRMEGRSTGSEGIKLNTGELKRNTWQLPVLMAT